MSEQIKVTAVIPAEAGTIYNAWLNGKEHGAMTGGKATASTKIGGKYTAGDGYISGKNLDLIPGKRILQSWRSTEFSDTDPDSFLLVKMEPVGSNTKLILIHFEIPDGQGASYKKGWLDFYLKPMKN